MCPAWKQLESSAASPHAPSLDPSEKVRSRSVASGRAQAVSGGLQEKAVGIEHLTGGALPCEVEAKA